ncbi:hypothetical protein H9Q13_16775 [Pontibacter sp. JH31]|uniref:Uncharacterized protein n=1 Tax=Pontibacter aquaedesilientis TaxID=2766980 RepID=A0ABR7XKP1_9BACT|nr:hypothetical protein [Pontibacter aquaedesilientis]MBD1398828.1 hypothetical protein [Pontibacter aquaedesilientis]
MVTITDFKKRKSEDGKDFNVLLLQGDIELIQSKESGRFYATAKVCTIPCTFNDLMCQGLIGKTLPGNIEKIECDPYDYHIPGTDEIISLAHTYYYDPVDRTMEQEVFQMKPAA